MSKKRTNPICDAGEAFNKQSNNSAEKNKKYLKYALFFLLEIAAEKQRA